MKARQEPAWKITMATKPKEIGDQGTCFVAPLINSQFAIGVFARRSPPRRGKANILLSYFFGPYFEEPNKEANAYGLRAVDAATILMCSALYLHSGRWKVLGYIEPWHSDEWPMIDFHRYDHIEKVDYRVVYADDDPNREIAEFPNEGKGLPVSSLAGSGAVEKILSELFQLRVVN